MHLWLIQQPWIRVRAEECMRTLSQMKTISQRTLRRNIDIPGIPHLQPFSDVVWLPWVRQLSRTKSSEGNMSMSCGMKLGKQSHQTTLQYRNFVMALNSMADDSVIWDRTGLTSPQLPISPLGPLGQPAAFFFARYDGQTRVCSLLRLNRWMTSFMRPVRAIGNTEPHKSLLTKSQNCQNKDDFTCNLDFTSHMPGCEWPPWPYGGQNSLCKVTRIILEVRASS